MFKNWCCLFIYAKCMQWQMCSQHKIWNHQIRQICISPPNLLSGATLITSSKSLISLLGNSLFSLCLRSIVCSGRHYSQVVYIEEGLGQGVHTKASYRFWKSWSPMLNSWKHEFLLCRGDLYHQNEPLTPVALRLLIWQLLVAVQYMHSCHVWHR